MRQTIGVQNLLQFLTFFIFIVSSSPTHSAGARLVTVAGVWRRL